MNKKIIILICILIIAISIGIFVTIKVLHKPEEETTNLSELDIFYNNEITKKYKDIRLLDEYYNKEEAQKDNCFVIGAMVHNDYLYYSFMKDYKNKEDAFIRVAQNTIEGDLYLYDIMYDSDKYELILVTDFTRDKFASDDNRIILLRKYKYITEYNYKGHVYWVIYNGELNDETFESNNTYILSLIN